MIKKEERRYYVYEWFNVDSGEVFYVGKGTRLRYRQLGNRNKFFLRYHNKYSCDVRIISNKMGNDEALILEHEVIMEYRKTGQCQTNITDGGENPPVMSGEKNGMFGKHHSQDTRDKISRIHTLSGRFKGAGNSQFGVSPKDRMAEETYKTWRAKQKARKFGKTNPNYGNKKLSMFYRDNPDVSKEKNSRAGIKNGRAIPVAMSNDNGFYKEFDYMILCAEYLVEKKIIETRAKNLSGIATRISSAAKNGSEYANHDFNFINK